LQVTAVVGTLKIIKTRIKIVGTKYNKILGSFLFVRNKEAWSNAAGKNNEIKKATLLQEGWFAAQDKNRNKSGIATKNAKNEVNLPIGNLLYFLAKTIQRKIAKIEISRRMMFRGVIKLSPEFSI